MTDNQFRIFDILNSRYVRLPHMTTNEYGLITIKSRDLTFQTAKAAHDYISIIGEVLIGTRVISEFTVDEFNIEKLNFTP